MGKQVWGRVWRMETKEILLMEFFTKQFDSGGTSWFYYREIFVLIVFVIPYCLLAGGEKDDRTVFALMKHLKKWLVFTLKNPKEIDLQDEVRKVEVYESLIFGEVHSTAKKASAPCRRELHCDRRTKLVTAGHRWSLMFFSFSLCHTLGLSGDFQIVALCIRAQGRLHIPVFKTHLSVQTSMKQPEVFGVFVLHSQLAGTGLFCQSNEARCLEILFLSFLPKAT